MYQQTNHDRTKHIGTKHSGRQTYRQTKRIDGHNVSVDKSIGKQTRSHQHVSGNRIAMERKNVSLINLIFSYFNGIGTVLRS
jgi:hypothetical protein